MITRHDGRLLRAIVAGAALGIVCGAWMGPAMTKIAWIGTLFLNALKMTIIPLIFGAVVSGVTSLGDVRRLGRLGSYTVVYYTATTAIAVLIGMIVVNIAAPGAGAALHAAGLPETVPAREPTSLTDIALHLFAPNLVAAASATDLLPIIVFALLFGAALTTTGERGRPAVAFFDALNETMMVIVSWLMYFAPIGIFALVAAQLGAAGGGMAFLHEVASVGTYVATVLVGLAVHCAVLFALLRILGGRGAAYLHDMMRALLTAFGTASSSATLPVTMECAAETSVDARAVRFVLPLGATVNMDGTALYEAVAVMFIAQAYGYDLGLAGQAVIFVTATLAAVGAAGIPQAGLVTMILVLSAVHLPQEGIGLLLAVDWLLDRFRTTVNVWGDCVGAAVVTRLLDRRAASAASDGRG